MEDELPEDLREESAWAAFCQGSDAFGCQDPDDAAGVLQTVVRHQVQPAEQVGVLVSVHGRASNPDI